MCAFVCVELMCFDRCEQVLGGIGKDTILSTQRCSRGPDEDFIYTIFSRRRDLVCIYTDLLGDLHEWEEQ